jgi:competence protein ComEC
MSFAATLALVAGYQQGLPWMTAGADTPLGARVALWGVAWILGSLVVSLLAGTATQPYAAYHFHRLGPYGALTNLLAMPVISAWVMPAGILGVAALPFGLDGPCWQLMGAGIDWMILIAPGDEPRAPSGWCIRQRSAPLHAGLVLLCCSRRRCASSAHA